MEEKVIMEDKKQKSVIKQIFLFTFQISLAVAIIVWMISKNKEQIIAAFENFHFIWLVPGLIFYATHIFVGAWRWRMLLNVQNIKITFFDSLSLTMQGFFFSLVLPGGALGGDVVKAAFLIKKTPKGNKLIGSFTILVDRIIGMSSLFALAAITTIFSYEALANLKGFSIFFVYLLIAGCIGGLGAAIVLFFHDKLNVIPGFKALLAFGDKISKNAVSRLINAIDSYRTAWKTILLAFLVSIVFVHTMIASVIFCIAGGLDANKASPTTYILATSIANAAECVPATQSGIGTRDYVLQTILCSGGIEKAKAITIALIYTAIILSFNLCGGLFFAFSKLTVSENKKLKDESIKE